MMAALYRLLTTAAGPAIDRLLARRLKRGKEHPQRLPERRGTPGLPRPDGPLVWVHGASVGEALSVLPLIERLLADRPGLHVLLTTGTVTSAALMADRLPPRALHQFVPVDRPAWVRRFLDHWRPDLALWMESEFWPNLVLETQKRGVPTVLINGRVSERSFRAWQRLPSLIAKLLRDFTLVLGQTEGDRARLEALGAPHTAFVGNIKFSAPPLPAADDALAALRAAVGGRPLWLAASTHAGEEAIAWQVHRRAAVPHHGLLTVVVPRHPERGPAVAVELEAAGARVVRRSSGRLPDAATDVYVADTMGEMGLFYRLARVVFVGKSLCGGGGQNPLEPARLGCAVLLGPRTANFADIAGRMTAAGAARPVADAGELAEAVSALLADAAARDALGRAAEAFAGAEAGALERVLERLEPLLAEMERRHARP
ncbi:3-deoxy-D-manno-octulosonic acid transferase [Novispirillum sp. DQ9]|uniref:3-deoxy-D-manno-octulosonic acid transferase n=1 Tax=Novispirillum sp. DQ9 TaxID=3398612 RepID=UPI003C7D263F